MVGVAGRVEKFGGSWTSAGDPPRAASGLQAVIPGVITLLVLLPRCRRPTGLEVSLGLVQLSLPLL